MYAACGRSWFRGWFWFTGRRDEGSWRVGGDGCTRGLNIGVLGGGEDRTEGGDDFIGDCGGWETLEASPKDIWVESSGRYEHGGFAFIRYNEGGDVGNRGRTCGVPLPI